MSTARHRFGMRPPMPKCDDDPCGWRTPPETRYRRCRSRLGEPLASGEVPRAFDRSRQAHEGAFLLLARKLKLITNDSASRHARLSSSGVQPLGQIFGY